MPVKIMVEGGTPKSDVPSLCYRCQYSVIRTNDRNEDKVQCVANDQQPVMIPDKIVRCSSYWRKEAPSMVMKTAWVYGRIYVTKGDKQVMSEERNFYPPGTNVY